MDNFMQRVAGPVYCNIKIPFRKIVLEDEAVDLKVTSVGVFENLRGQIKLIILIVSKKNSYEFYWTQELKFAKYGIFPFLCWLAKYFSHANLLISPKVVAQVNVKLGVEPWILTKSAAKCGVMVVGVDVCHVSVNPAGVGNRLVGGTVSTFDLTFCRHTPHIQVFTGFDVCKQVGQTITMAAMKYRAARNELPNRIFIYRSGVGYGQMGDSARKEIEESEDRIGQIYKKADQPLPKISFVLVSKRIDVQSMKVTARAGSNGLKDTANPFSGNPVDEIGVFPERYQFYLINQQAGQATISPTSYSVLRDDGNWSPERLQMFTYKLSQICYTKRRNHAIPAVWNYAENLALRISVALVN